MIMDIGCCFHPERRCPRCAVALSVIVPAVATPRRTPVPRASPHRGHGTGDMAPGTWQASTGGALPEDRPPDPYEGGSVVDGEIQVVGHAH